MHSQGKEFSEGGFSGQRLLSELIAFYDAVPKDGEGILIYSRSLPLTQGISSGILFLQLRINILITYFTYYALAI